MGKRVGGYDPGADERGEGPRDWVSCVEEEKRGRPESLVDPAGVEEVLSLARVEHDDQVVDVHVCPGGDCDGGLWVGEVVDANAARRGTQALGDVSPTDVGKGTVLLDVDVVCPAKGRVILRDEEWGLGKGDVDNDQPVSALVGDLVGWIDVWKPVQKARPKKRVVDGIGIRPFKRLPDFDVSPHGQFPLEKPRLHGVLRDSHIHNRKPVPSPHQRRHQPRRIVSVDPNVVDRNRPWIGSHKICHIVQNFVAVGRTISNSNFVCPLKSDVGKGFQIAFHSVAHDFDGIRTCLDEFGGSSRQQVGVYLIISL